MSTDGLNESQREQLRAKFASGMGHRSDPAEFKRDADLIARLAAWDTEWAGDDG